MSHIVIFVTVGAQDEAARLAQTLVEERLAACANLVPAISSTYWWQGKIEQAGETLLVLKTRQDLLEALTTRVRELHSYAVPEVIALPILGGNSAYLRWIDESVRHS